MRAMWFGICLGAILLSAQFVSRPTLAIPAHGESDYGRNIRDVQLVEDTCWWWGLRWQYGWHGYGWYPCWDWTKPLAPSLIAPEASPPPETLPAESCVQRWRDEVGNWHTRNLC